MHTKMYRNSKFKKNILSKSAASFPNNGCPKTTCIPAVNN